jgi:hypothetical protein
MDHHYHFEHHRLEAQLARRRLNLISTVVAMLLLVAVVAAYSLGWGRRHNPYTCPTPVPDLPQLGVVGNSSCVQSLQWYLNNPSNGQGPGLTENGYYDDSTARAVKAYQQNHRLQVTGQVQSDTWQSLVATTANQPVLLPVSNLAAPKLEITARTMNSLALAWRTVPGASGYQLYRGGLQIASLNSAGYSDDGLKPDHSYVYTVRSADSTGKVSLASVAASASTLIDPSAPAPATGPTTSNLPLVRPHGDNRPPALLSALGSPDRVGLAVVALALLGLLAIAGAGLTKRRLG